MLAVVAVVCLALAVVAVGGWFLWAAPGGEEPVASSTTVQQVEEPPVATGDLAACAGAVEPATSPLAPPVTDGVPRATGGLDGPGWAVPVAADRVEGTGVVASTDGVVTVEVTDDERRTLVGLSSGDGSTVFSVALDGLDRDNPAGAGKVVYGPDSVWFVHGAGSGNHVAEVDLTSGAVTGCWPAPTDGFWDLQVASGRPFTVKFLPNTDGRHEITMLGPDAPVWTVEGLYDTVLSAADDAVVALGLAGGTLYRTPEASVAVLGATDGSLRSVTPIKELTSSLTSLDGSPEPVWDQVGDNESIEGLVGAPVAASIVPSADGTTFAFSPAAFIRSAQTEPYAMYVLSLDTAGNLAWGGWVWRTSDPLRDAGDGRVWVPPATVLSPAAEPTRATWLLTGPGGAEPVQPGPGYATAGPPGVGYSTWGDEGPAAVLAGPSGEIGRIPGVYLATYPRSNALTATGWAGVFQTDEPIDGNTADRLTRRSYIALYQIPGTDARPAPSPDPSPDPSPGPDRG